MKKKLAFIAAFALLLTAFGVFRANAYAGFKIFINGSELIYPSSAASPQILNNRAMLPIADTMSLLGVSLDWNQQTGVLVMVKDGVAATHVLYSDTITINGTVRKYDTPSAIVGDQALIPSIMVADIIGCDTWWDGANRMVVMRSKTGPNAFAKPGIISFSSNKQQVMAGEELIVNIIANPQTSVVSMFDASGRIVATSSSYVKSGDNNSFTLKYVPYIETISFIQYKIQAGNSEGYNPDSAKSVYFSVNQGLNLVGASLSSESVYVGGTAKITVTTSNNVTRVRLTDTATYKTYEQSSYTLSGVNRVFQFEIKMSETGNKSFSVDIGSNYTYVKTARSLSFTVADAPRVAAAINNISYTNKTYAVGERSTASVRASLSTVEIEVYDSQRRSSTTYTSFRESGGNRVFDISVSPSVRGSNSFTVTAYDGAGRSASKSFSLSAGTTYYPSSSYYTYYDYNSYYPYGYYDNYGNYYPYYDYNGYYGYYGYYNNDYCDNYGYYSYNGNYGYYDSYGNWHYYNNYYNNYGYYDSYGNWYYYNNSYSAYGYYDSSGKWHYYGNYPYTTHRPEIDKSVDAETAMKQLINYASGNVIQITSGSSLTQAEVERQVRVWLNANAFSSSNRLFTVDSVAIYDSGFSLGRTGTYTFRITVSSVDGYSRTKTSDVSVSIRFTP